MTTKTKIIFISTFIIVLTISIGVYLWVNRNTLNQNGEAPWYQSFNPFGTGKSVTETPTTNTTVDENGNVIKTELAQNSKFHQITDYAIAGASFFEESRPIEQDSNQIKEPEEVKTIISPLTKDGRKDIQTFLNNTLSLKPALIVDGNFGKKAEQAIKDFQKLNNLTITGKIDTETAPYFTKTTKLLNLVEKKQFEQAPSIRFVERKNGHIYKMFLDTKIKEKISNSTIPSVYEAILGGEGKTVVYRYLSENNIINSFITTGGEQSGEFLPQNISDFSISLDKNKFFYLIEGENGVTGTMGAIGSTKRDIVFNHPFTEWLSSWDNKQNVYLTTKASYGVPGSTFILDSAKKTISKLFGGVDGLTTSISPDGSLILYSYGTDTGPKLGVFNIKEHTSSDLDLYGLSEKCVWSNDNNYVYCGVPSVVKGYQYPDYWYQGLVSFDDIFMKINVVTGEKETIANSAEEVPIDATYLFLDKEENSLFFTNKKDSTLWSLDLK